MADDARILRRDLARLQQTVKQLATAVSRLTGVDLGPVFAAVSAVNAKTQRAAVTLPSLVVGSTDVTITWPTAWPDTAYAVIPTIVSGTGALGNLAATLKVGTKTTADCVVTVANTGLVSVGTFAVDVIGIRT